MVKVLPEYKRVGLLWVLLALFTKLTTPFVAGVVEAVYGLEGLHRVTSSAHRFVAHANSMADKKRVNFFMIVCKLNCFVMVLFSYH